MSVLIVGGCHVSGYKVRPSASFAELLRSYLNTGSRCLSPLPLKRHALIQEALAEDHPDMVVLQLGNYEFHGSLRRLLHKSKKGEAPAMQEGAGSTGADGVPLVTPESRLKTAFRIAILPVFVLYLILRNRSFLKTIRSYVSRNRESRFLILTPIPCLMFSDNITRRLAGRYFKLIFRGMANVSFIDLFEPQGLFGPDCYADPSHLNEKGHRKLFEHITRCI